MLGIYSVGIYFQTSDFPLHRAFPWSWSWLRMAWLHTSFCVIVKCHWTTSWVSFVLSLVSSSCGSFLGFVASIWGSGKTYSALPPIDKATPTIGFQHFGYLALLVNKEAIVLGLPWSFKYNGHVLRLFLGDKELFPKLVHSHLNFWHTCQVLVWRCTLCRTERKHLFCVGLHSWVVQIAHRICNYHIC